VYLENFDPEQIWIYYQAVIERCTDAAWTTLSAANKDIFMHLKLRALSLGQGSSQEKGSSSNEAKLTAEVEMLKEENRVMKARLDTVEEIIRKHL